MSILLIASPEEYKKIILVRNTVAQWVDVVWDTTVNLSQLTEEVQQNEHEAIVVAVKPESLAEQIKQFIGILRSVTIVDFFDLYERMMPDQMVDRVMCNPNITSYDGMILGLSHAEVGILPEHLAGNWCNLAVSSQDIYYNMKSFEYCLANYSNQIKNLKYLVIDMFDYTYFNYDVSLGKNAFTYYTGRGLLCDGHHFDTNKHFGFPFDALKQRMCDVKTEGVSESQLKWWEQLFDAPYMYDNYRDVVCHFTMSNRIRVVTEEDVKNYFVTSSITRNTFEDTISENVECMKKLLRMAFALNPDIQIYMVILPQYAKAVKKARASFYRWKNSFYKTIEELSQKYSFVFLDYKNDAMSENALYFQDIDHLNFYGAQHFTNMLSKEINWNND